VLAKEFACLLGIVPSMGINCSQRGNTSFPTWEKISFLVREEANKCKKIEKCKGLSDKCSNFATDLYNIVTK
jgi:hypothetical protein